MSIKGLQDPITKKSYKFTGLVVPARAIASQCQESNHSTCDLVPQIMANKFGIEVALKYGCLCQCHGVVE